MKTPTLSCSKTLILTGTVASCAAVAPLHAEPVNLQFMGNGPQGAMVEVSLAGGLTFSDGTSSRSMWAGSQMFESQSQMFTTWAAGLDADASSGDFEIRDLRSAMGETEQGLRKAEALGRLFSATNSRSEMQSAAHAAAFQAVIWEIIHDYEGVDGDISLTQGDVRVAGIDSRLFGLYRHQALHGNGAKHTFTYWESTIWQNQLGPRIVPLPTAGAFTAAGLGLLVVRRRRTS